VKKWIITGASGSVASACINILLKNKFSVDAYSRNNLKISHKNINYSQVDNYNSIFFNLEHCECLLIAQGYFRYEVIEKLSSDELDTLIEANFVSQVKVLYTFLKHVKKDKKIDIVLLGSTSAYEAGSGTVVYGAAKAGVLGLVKALNKEYVDSDVRFWCVSFGTIANEMGNKVPNQDPDSLLNVDLVAQEIFDTVSSSGNSWQPEIVIRRRHIRTLN